MDTAFSKQALLVPGGSGQRSGLEGAPTISEAKGEIVRVLKQMDALRPAPGEQRTSGSRERWGDLQQPAPPSFLQQPLPPRKLPPPPPPSFKPLHCSSSSSSSSASEKRKTESTGEGDPAGKRARADDGGVDDRGDLPVRSSSSREPMAVQGLGGSTTSVARSEAADSGASKVPSKDPPAPAAPVLQREIRELAEYRDRLQGEFQEAYELLPRPVVMMTRLAAEFEEAEAEKKQGAPAGAKKGRAPSKSGVRLPGKRKQDPTAIEISEEDMLKIQEFIEYCKQNLDEIEHAAHIGAMLDEEPEHFGLGERAEALHQADAVMIGSIRTRARLEQRCALGFVITYHRTNDRRVTIVIDLVWVRLCLEHGESAALVSI
jgi:hypothetical protein